MLDDVCGRLLSGHQSHRFACIDIGEIVVLAANGLCKLLTRFVGLWKRIDLGVPLIGKAIAQCSTGILRRPGKSLRYIERAGENGVRFSSLHDTCAGLLRVLTFRRGKQCGSDPDSFGTGSKGRSDPSRRCDAARNEHRHLNRVKHGLQQWKGTHLTRDVSSGLRSLHHDEIDSVARCLHGISSCVDLRGKHNAVLMQLLHIGSGGTKRKGDEKRVGLYRRL